MCTRTVVLSDHRNDSLLPNFRENIEPNQTYSRSVFCALLCYILRTLSEQNSGRETFSFSSSLCGFGFKRKRLFAMPSNDDFSDVFCDPSELITDKHFEAWGRIVFACAKMETGIRIALTRILALPLHEVAIFTESHTTLTLRNIAKSVAKLYLSDELADEFIEILGSYGALSRVRNHIGHNHWTFGERPRSLKPVRMDIRSGRADAKGYEAGETDYTLDDFASIANKLFNLNIQLIHFIQSERLTEHMMRKTIENKAEAERSIEHVYDVSSLPSK